jgi:ATP synthase protein I
MTTATRQQGQAPRVTGTRPLLVAAAAVLVVAGLLVLAAGLAHGADAAYAALVGSLVAAAVLLLGTFTVNVVAGLVPSASLLVALLTYVLQVVLMAVAFARLSNSALAEDPTSRGWLAGAVIAATAAWLVTQIWVATRARIPAYDLPPTTPAEGGPTGEGGGER